MEYKFYFQSIDKEGIFILVVIFLFLSAFFIVGLRKKRADPSLKIQDNLYLSMSGILGSVAVSSSAVEIKR